MTPHRVFVEPVMGTVASIHVHGAAVGSSAVDAAVAHAVAGLRRHEQVFSTYRAGSDISRLRRGEATLAQLDPTVAVVAERCDRATNDTGGLFDAQRQGWFDPTGYVKGWAVDDVVDRHLGPLLGLPGITAVGINVGGDMRLLRDPDSEWIWRIGIADPRSGDLLATLAIDSGAVATSGTAERGAHILDPRTGRPSAGVLSATVVADDLTTADLWATTAVVAGLDDLERIRRAPVRSGLVVGAAGEVRRWIAGVGVDVDLLTPAGA